MAVVSHRACCGLEATRVIASVPIHIAVVDLGLPLRAPDAAARTHDAASGAASGAADAPAASASPAPSPIASEEGGIRLLEVLARQAEPPPTVVVKRGLTHRDDSRELAAALRAGAFAVIDRPRDAADLESMLDVLRRCLLRYYRGRWPGA
jgi:DNA-binding NarL/FixJ family response regulator